LIFGVQARAEFLRVSVPQRFRIASSRRERTGKVGTGGFGCRKIFAQRCRCEKKDEPKRKHIQSETPHMSLHKNHCQATRLWDGTHGAFRFERLNRIGMLTPAGG
jgi:hypothetical protein